MNINKDRIPSFTLNCNIWKIAKHVPGIINIFNKPFYGVNGDSAEYRSLLERLVTLSAKATKSEQKRIISINYVSSLDLNHEQIERFVDDFSAILSNQQFSEYNLAGELDNLLLLMLYLYDNFWDNEGTSYNTPYAFMNFPDIGYKNWPKEYLDMSKAKELALFVKSFYNESQTSNIALTHGKQYSIIKDSGINAYLKHILIKGLLDEKALASDLREIFGDQGLGLILNLREKYDDDQRKKLDDNINYILNYKLENPFPQRNEDISYICLTLRQYLTGTGLMGTNQKLLSEDHLRLFAEILNLFEMKFSDKSYDEEEYRDNLAVTIRGYLKKKKRK